jgi:hypothetical protein
MSGADRESQAKGVVPVAPAEANGCARFAIPRSRLARRQIP